MLQRSYSKLRLVFLTHLLLFNLDASLKLTLNVYSSVFLFLSYQGVHKKTDLQSADRSSAWQRPILTGGSPQLLSAFKCLTSVFGMGTGVTTWLSSPDDRARALKTEVINKHLLEQGLDRLVSLSSTCRHASTRDLSTSSSLRGLS